MAAHPLTDAALARTLIREIRTAALATLEAEGGPFASHVDTAPADDGSPLLLLSRLAVHSRNLARDSRASLLFVRHAEPGSDAASVRLTLTGRLFPDGNPRLRAQFLAAVPHAERYAAFSDFSVHRFDIAAGHLVAGFGRIVGLPGSDLIDTTSTRDGPS